MDTATEPLFQTGVSVRIKNWMLNHVNPDEMAGCELSESTLYIFILQDWKRYGKYHALIVLIKAYFD